MCRFVAYLGKPILLNEILSKPKDSLIQQSHSAQESEIKINADGFGIGWYRREVSEEPAIFVSPLPAWNDLNFKRISHYVMSPCFFGHVRAAAEGGVNVFNCHPFAYKNWMLMHNGGIGGFKRIRRDIVNLVSEELFLHIRGQTDSEHMFALWLHYFLPSNQTHQDMIDAWRKTLKTIEELQAKHHVKESSSINSMVTDGEQIVGVRYSSGNQAPLSLHYSAGERFQHTKDGCHMLPSKGHIPESVLIVSEKLTGFESEWHDVPAQHIISVNSHKAIHCLPI